MIGNKQEAKEHLLKWFKTMGYTGPVKFFSSDARGLTAWNIECADPNGLFIVNNRGEVQDNYGVFGGHGCQWYTKEGMPLYPDKAVRALFRGDMVLLFLPADLEKKLERRVIKCAVLEGDTGQEANLHRADSYTLQSRENVPERDIQGGQIIDKISREMMILL